MGKWINFIKQESTGKTEIHNVFSKEGNLELGTIKWYSAWRCYTFQPKPETIFETDCLQDITDKIKSLMEDRKKLKESTNVLKHIKLFE